MKSHSEEKEILHLKKVFAAIIHEKRLKNKMTQERLSEIIGITDVYLRCIESGKNVPNWIIWLKLCTALEVDVFEIQQRFFEPYILNKTDVNSF